MSIPYKKRRSSPLLVVMLVLGLGASVFVATNGVGFLSKAFTPGTVANSTVFCSTTQSVEYPISVSIGEGNYLLISGNTVLEQSSSKAQSSSIAYYSLSNPCNTLSFYEYTNTFAIEPIYANLAAHPFLKLHKSISEANSATAGKTSTELLGMINAALQQKTRISVSQLSSYMDFSDKLQSYYYSVTGTKYHESVPKPQKPLSGAKSNATTVEISTSRMQDAVKTIFSNAVAIKSSLLPLDIVSGEITAMPLSGTVILTAKPDGTIGKFVVVFYNALGNGNKVITTNMAVAEITKELVEQGKFPKTLTFTRATLFTGNSEFSNMQIVSSASVTKATVDEILVLATDNAQSTGTKLLKINSTYTNLFDSRKVMYCTMANVRNPIVNEVAVGGNRVEINDPVGVGSQQCSWTTDKSLASVIVQSIGNYGTSYASVADGSFHVALSYSNAGGVGLIQDVKGNFNAKKTVGTPVVVKGLSVKCSRSGGCSRAALIPKSLQNVSGVYRVSYVQNSYSLTRGNGEASVPHLVFGAIDIILPKPTAIVTDDPAIAHCEQQKGRVIEKSDKTMYCALPLGTVCELQDFYKRICPTVPTPVVTVPAPPVADLAYKHCILNKGEVIAGVSDNVRVRYCKLPNGVKCELSQYYNNVCPTVVVAPTALPPDSNISTAIRYCNSNRGTVVRVKEASSTAYKYVCKTASKTTCELWDFYYGTCR